MGPVILLRRKCMKKGFTLTELLVVVLIIAILSSVALPQYMKAVEKARATEAIELLGTLARAESAYYLTNDTYTTGLDELGIVLPGISATPSLANTTNFQFQAVSANSTRLIVNAKRKSDSDQYHIWLIMNDQGQVDVCCSGDSAMDMEPDYCDPEEETTDTCKSIANEAHGILRKEIGVEP